MKIRNCKISFGQYSIQPFAISGCHEIRFPLGCNASNYYQQFVQSRSNEADEHTQYKPNKL